MMIKTTKNAMAAWDYLDKTATDLKVKGQAKRVLNHEKILFWPGSLSSHHYCNGGLVVHIAEVVRLGLACLKCLNVNVCHKEYYLASLYHDFGKLWDYIRHDGTWAAAKHRNMVGHVTRSALEWSKVRGSETMPNVLHAILAHHGRHEWRSPAEPQTQLAYLLHYCDSISARLNQVCD